MSESLEQNIATKFSHLNDTQLIRRIEQAEDFGYDDESVELTRRLKLVRLAWRWAGDYYRPHVEIYQPEGGVDERDL